MKTSTNTDLLSPLQPGGPLIAHFGYLNMGSTWMIRTLMNIGRRFELNVQFSRTRFEQLQYNTNILIAQHSHLRPDKLRQFRGTHLIRDLRDVVVFGYFRHRDTKEAWAHRPLARYGGRTYHAVLNSVDEHQGLLEEIRQLSEYAKRYSLRRWNYSDSPFLEIRYEDVLANPVKVFQNVFKHFLFDKDSAKEAIHIGRGAGRRIAREDSFVTRLESTSGFWREYMKPEHVAYFKELLGDLLIQMDYESDNAW